LEEINMSNLIQWLGPSTGETYDSTIVYSSTSETGTYTALTTVTPITTTLYWDTTGTSSNWYKIAFYKTSGAITGSLSAAFYAGGAAVLYTNPTELRKFMQYDVADFPNDEDVTLLLQQGQVQLHDDAGNITDVKKFKLLSLFLGACFVSRAMASRALSKGYVSVSLEGGSIMKAFDALMRQAEYWFDLYQAQLAKDTVDYAITTFTNGVVNINTTQDILDIMNGISDALDIENTYKPSQSRNWRA
jgi:hypothetical protein